MSNIFSMFWFPALFFIVEAIFFVFTGKRFVILARILFEIVVLIIYPLLFFSVDLIPTDEITKVLLYIPVFLCLFAYFTSYRTEPFQLKYEIIMNLFLALGILINIVIACILISEPSGWISAVIGNLPIILTIGLAMLRNYRIVKEDLDLYGY